MNKRPSTHLDLCSGIGGFAHAASWLGLETVAFCEIDPKARAILEKDFPGIPIHEDLKTLDGKQYEGIDLLTAGYPCQPFSLVGKRKGKEDPRHLWPEVRRVITRSRPSWVLCENVIGHYTMGLDEVLSDLESEGYAARSFIIPSCAVDGPSERKRVWIAAHRHCGKKRAERLRGMQTRKAPARPRLLLPDRERVDNGIPSWYDRIKLVGNAIDPFVAYEIMKAMAS